MALFWRHKFKTERPYELCWEVWIFHKGKEETGSSLTSYGLVSIKKKYLELVAIRNWLHVVRLESVRVLHSSFIKGEENKNKKSYLSTSSDKISLRIWLLWPSKLWANLTHWPGAPSETIWFCPNNLPDSWTIKNNLGFRALFFPFAFNKDSKVWHSQLNVQDSTATTQSNTDTVSIYPSM